jgi:hypothetical protein
MANVVFYEKPGCANNARQKALLTAPAPSATGTGTTRWCRISGRARCSAPRYSGNPFGPHRDLNFRPEHFDRWIALFTAAARQVLEPTAAERAVAKVQHMSLCFQAGLVSPVPGYAQGAASQTSGTEVPS